MSNVTRRVASMALAAATGVYAGSVAAVDLAAMNRWVGVVIAFIGSIVVAPAGTGELLRSAFGTARSTRALMSKYIRMLVPVRWRKPRSGGVIVAGAASLAMSATQAGVRIWPGSASVDERIEALRQHIDDLEGALSAIRKHVAQEVTDRRTALANVMSELRNLTHRLETSEREAARIDARGLPVIGLGILLSGVPDDLAQCSAGWIFPAIGVFFGASAAMEAVLSESSSAPRKV